MSALCLVHQRFSTNTFPTWQLAHPFRFICHNGEINTVRGNVNWMYARQSSSKSPLFERHQELFPVIPGGSDSPRSTTRSRCCTMSGRELPHVMAMLIPEAWDADTHDDAEKKAFYEYHASLMEPWDGPAAVAFTDGRMIGATLDRNGLRPARYLVTNDNILIMASETGVLPVKPEDVKYKGRLQPGKMLLVDLEQRPHRSRRRDQATLAARQPYGEWLKQNQIKLDKLPAPSACARTDFETLLQRQRAFGYTDEDICDADDAHGGQWRRSRLVRWARTRRWPVFPTNRSRCSTISSSCLRR